MQLKEVGMVDRCKCLLVGRMFAVGLVIVGVAAAPSFSSASEGASEDPAVVAVDRTMLGVKSPSALEMPEELLNWPNMEPPGARGPARSLAADPHETVIFEPATGKETILPSIQSIEGTEPMMIDGFVGLAPNDDQGESVIGDDDRTLITSVTTFPWRSVVKLYVEAADGSNWICSGEMIDAFHVMTAGHCAYLHDNGGWAAAIRVVPGMDQSYWPYSYAWSNLTRTYTGWTVDENRDHDWAVLRLDRNVGGFTGWMGRITAATGNAIYTETMNVAGYPGDLDGGQRMYYDADAGSLSTDFRHYYWADTAGGMSGGPVWRYVSPDRWIMTVHAYGNGGSGNSGPRLNQNKYDQINTWLGEDTPPTDYADLVDDGNASSGFSPSTVTRDVTGYSAWNDTRNSGTASSGTFDVDFYASTNTIISTGDYFIGRAAVSSISPFSFANVSLTGTFPQAIPAGTYNVGWILDADGEVPEFLENNNTAVTSGLITVLDPCSLDAHEPNGSSGTANPISLNTSQTHSICLEGDEDWMQFVLSEELEVTIATTGPTASDTVVYLYNSSVVQIGYDDDGGPGLYSLLTGVYPAGTYYIRVIEYASNDYIPSYNVALSAAASPVIFADGFERGTTSAWSSSVP